MLKKLWLLVPILASINCLPYVYHMRDTASWSAESTWIRRWRSRGSSWRKVGLTPLLTLWAIRDQIVSVDQARTISRALLHAHRQGCCREGQDRRRLRRLALLVGDLKPLPERRRRHQGRTRGRVP